MTSREDVEVLLVAANKRCEELAGDLARVTGEHRTSELAEIQRLRAEVAELAARVASAEESEQETSRNIEKVIVRRNRWRAKYEQAERDLSASRAALSKVGADETRVRLARQERDAALAEAEEHLLERAKLRADIERLTRELDTVRSGDLLAVAHALGIVQRALSTPAGEPNADEAIVDRLVADRTANLATRSIAKPADPGPVSVPRGHCGVCSRCYWPLVSIGKNGCWLTNCAVRPMPDPRTHCACGAPYLPAGGGA